MAKPCREPFREEPEESIDRLLEYVRCPDNEDGSTTVVDTFTPAHKEPHATVDGDSADTPANKPHELSQRGRQQALAKHFSNCSTRRPSPVRRRNSTPMPDSIHLAAKNGDVVALAVHLQTASTIEKLDDEGMQALHYAAAYGYPEATQMLVQSNAPLDACNHEGSTPLFLACRYARKDCIQELIAAGVRKEGSVETRYISALHSAAYNGNVECIEVLLEAKAQVQAKDIDDWTPLHYATRFNRIGAMELLIQAQADVNAMDTIGWTPGHTACRNGLGNALEILLRHNVDISVCSKSNETLMHIASRKGKARVLKTLVGHAEKLGILPALLKIKDGRGMDVLACAQNEYIRTILREKLHQGDEKISLYSPRRREYQAGNGTLDIVDFRSSSTCTIL